jgi:hypothetical protein
MAAGSGFWDGFELIAQVIERQRLIDLAVTNQALAYRLLSVTA